MFYLRVIPKIQGCGNHTITVKKLSDGSLSVRVIPETKNILLDYGVGFLTYESVYRFLLVNQSFNPMSIHKTSLELPIVFERDILVED